MFHLFFLHEGKCSPPETFHQKKKSNELAYFFNSIIQTWDARNSMIFACVGREGNSLIENLLQILTSHGHQAQSNNGEKLSYEKPREDAQEEQENFLPVISFSC